jgi:SNF2 family DNA or RNA helicase
MPILKPHKYQIEAAYHLYLNPYTALFADPGTGKTAILLMVLHELKKRGHLLPTLIVSTLRIATQVWPAEIKKWNQFQHFSYSVIQGYNKEKKASVEADLHITNFESLKWLNERGLLDRYKILVIDESSKVKNWSAQRTKILKRRAPFFVRRYALTGTPTPRSMLDLFAQMYLVDCGASLGRYISHFRMQYFENKGYGVYADWQLKQNADEAIYKKIEKHCYRLDGDKLLDMPPLIENNIEIDLPPKQIKQIKTLLDKIDLEANGLKTLNAGSEYMQARRIAGGLSADGTLLHDLKFQALDDLLSELQGKNVLLFFHFRTEGAELARRYNAPLIWGGTKATESTRLIDTWNAGELPLLLMHPQATGHGLNLQAGGNDLIWFSLTDNYDDDYQAVRRVWRQGVEGTVRVHRLIAKGSIDTPIMKGLACKGDRQKALLDAIRELKEGKAHESE